MATTAAHACYAVDACYAADPRAADDDACAAAASACRSLFPSGPYQVIYADPPWDYDFGGNMPDKPYDAMTLDQLKALPVGAAADRDACLFMWATNPLLKDAIELMEAWGFRYVTVYKTWLKRTSSGKRACTPGYWSMSSTELVLLGTRGRMQRFKTTSSVKQELEAERRAHSEKPACVRDEIQQLLDVRSRLELFSRHVVDGWDAWGLEVPGYFRSDRAQVSAPQAEEKVQLFLHVTDETTGRVRLLYRVRSFRSHGTQTDAGTAAVTRRTTHEQQRRSSGESTALSASTPQKRAAQTERVPVSRNGVPITGIARPSRKGFAKWWHGPGPDGQPRNRTYTVDARYLETAEDVRSIVAGRAS